MKFNTVKSKVVLFLSILTLLGTIFCIVSCDNFLSQNLGKTTININLDLSKLIKNSRNDATQITGYVLKLFVYDAKNYQEGDKQVENLPLVTQTSNKVDINGTVKASLEVSIDTTVIFVGKLFTLNENDIESDKPLYAGKSEVFKVQPKDNKVHLVLTKTHTHTFASEWTYDGAYHWKAATCEHAEEVSEFAEHTFSAWTTTKEATEEEAGSKERSCDVCNYKETTGIAQLVHTHTFSSDWTYDGAYHWKDATCGHIEEVSEKSKHTFDGIACTECDYEIEGFALIPAGTFKMGSNQGFSDNKPVHEVTITKDFYIGKYEVTQGEYEKHCIYGGSSPSSDYGYGDNYPAYYVSWYDALVYCNERSIDEGLSPCYSIDEETDPTKWGIVPTSKDDTWDAVVCDWGANGYRLPTEAEWEYAARAGDNTVDTLIYSGTNDENKLGEYAWYNSNSNSKTHEVGTKKANAFGLYDMSGNVWEWCWNWFTDEYNDEIEGGSDPTGALSGSRRVNRGGGWNNNSDSCSVSNRSLNNPYVRGDLLCFRLVRASSK